MAFIVMKLPTKALIGELNNENVLSVLRGHPCAIFFLILATSIYELNVGFGYGFTLGLELGLGRDFEDIDSSP